MAVGVDTIAAIATAPGAGGIGVIRVSGPLVEQVIRVVVGRVLEPRMARFVRFVEENGNLIDEGLALHFPAPNSYTGEDVLELQVHGASVVLDRLLERCLAAGARQADPGEFTKRAYLNGKLDLVQAEAVADLIAARTVQAARSAARSLSGEFSKRVEAFQTELTSLRVIVEGSLDFPEEGIDFLRDSAVAERLSALRAALESAIAAGSKGKLQHDGVRIVLLGPPNSGKSSIINMLCLDDVAIVTSIPGTTRDLIKATIQIHGIPVEIVDTAGLRETSDVIEGMGIERTWDAVCSADLAVLVLDATSVESWDDGLFRRLPDDIPRLVVHNKIDLSGASPGRTDMNGRSELWISALTGAGVDELRDALVGEVPVSQTGEWTFSARSRHLTDLKRCRDALQRAVEGLHSPELVAEDLRGAQEALSALVGEYVADDLLGEIFSRFCIGK